MPAYLTKAEFINITIMPVEFINAIEAKSPGFVDKQLEIYSALIDSRLVKRYGVPFQAPYPLMVTLWLTRIVTHQLWLRRGSDPNDEQYQDVKAAALSSYDELKEAADAQNGLFDLPLRADTNLSGVDRIGPFGYSEQSPYVWATRQATTGRDEDRNGRGSGD